MIKMEDIQKNSILCSFWGQSIIRGDISSVKDLYMYAWKEHPAIIDTIGQLQGCLTSVEIENSTVGVYSNEFLYYWGMICLGEQSPLIGKELETAETCFQKIKGDVPKAKARLAYINLLLSNRPLKHELHAAWLEVLRQYASKQRDLFSMIVLAKVCFQGFLTECQENDFDQPITGLPPKVVNLLKWPCQQGHPVAIRFWNEILTCIGTPETVDMHLSETCIWPQVLLDFDGFKEPANIQIRL